MHSYQEYLDQIKAGEREIYAGDIAALSAAQHFAAGTSNMLVVIDDECDRMTCIDIDCDEDCELRIAGIQELSGPFDIYRATDHRYMQSVQKWHALVYPYENGVYAYDRHSDRYESSEGSEHSLGNLNEEIRDRVRVMLGACARAAEATGGGHGAGTDALQKERRGITTYRARGESERRRPMTGESTIVIYGPHEYRALAYCLKQELEAKAVCRKPCDSDRAATPKGSIRMQDIPIGAKGAPAGQRIGNNTLLTLWMTEEDAEARCLAPWMPLRSPAANTVGGVFRVYKDLAGNIALMAHDRIVELREGPVRQADQY